MTRFIGKQLNEGGVVLTTVGTVAHLPSCGVAMGKIEDRRALQDFVPAVGSLAFGSRSRRKRRRDVSDDAGLRDVLLSGLVQQRSCLQIVPAPVDQPQTCSHHN